MKKILILVALTTNVAFAQVEKIDILPNYTAVYDIKMTFLKQDTIKVSDFNLIFSDSCELVTFNITTPVKRLMKFYSISDGVPKSVVELSYTDMTIDQKNMFDAFINKY
jgi:hypothetical protein